MFFFFIISFTCMVHLHLVVIGWISYSFASLGFKHYFSYLINKIQARKWTLCITPCVCVCKHTYLLTGESIAISAVFEIHSSRTIIPYATLHQTQTFYANGKCRVRGTKFTVLTGKPKFYFLPLTVLKSYVNIFIFVKYFHVSVIVCDMSSL